MKKILIKILIPLSIIIILGILLDNNDIYNKYNKYIFDNDIDFIKIRNKTKKLLGIKNKDKYVSGNIINYNSINNYKSYCKLSFDNNYIVTNLKERIVTFIGQKEELGNTIIVESINGIEYWYGNLDNINVNLYDNIKTNTILGITKDNNLYIKMIKEGLLLNCEKYI